MSRGPTPLALALLVLAGCRGVPSDRLPDDPDELTVFSIDGATWLQQGGVPFPEQGKGEVLLGYPVLGKAEVREPDVRRKVVATVKDAARTGGSPAACFIPRHAVRAVKGGRAVQAVICFECSIYEVYRGDAGAREGLGTISKAAEPLLTKVLSDAGVPLAPPLPK